jgi:putative oxidoreductase
MTDLLHLAAHGLNQADVASTLLRVSMGTFFAISGYNKLTNAGRHAGLVATLEADHVPDVKLMQWWVPGWELVAGSLLALGLFSAFAAAVLFILIGVACVAEGPKRVEEWKPINQGDRVADWLYLQEVLYALILASTALAGPGPFSLDHLFF